MRRALAVALVVAGCGGRSSHESEDARSGPSDGGAPSGAAGEGSSSGGRAAAGAGGRSDAGRGGEPTSGTSGAGGTPSGGGGSTGGTNRGGTAGSSSGGTGATTTCGTAVTASPANNYALESRLSFPPVAVMPDADLTFDWSAVTRDFLGRPLDPRADVAQLNMMLWALPYDELEQRLHDDAFSQRDLVIGAMYAEPEATAANLFDLVSFAGADVTPDEFLAYLAPAAYPPDTNTYTVMLASSTSIGEETRLIQAFKLDPTSTNTTVTLTDDSTVLDFRVDLLSHTRTRVPAGTPEISVDWASMDGGVNALGGTFVVSAISEAVVARYTETPEELEGRFLDMDRIAADLYRREIQAGTSVDLSTFQNESGRAFPGIDEAGTWVLALFCGNCRNPAPWYLTILTPCER